MRSGACASSGPSRPTTASSYLSDDYSPDRDRPRRSATTSGSWRARRRSPTPTTSELLRFVADAGLRPRTGAARCRSAGREPNEDRHHRQRHRRQRRRVPPAPRARHHACTRPAATSAATRTRIPWSRAVAASRWTRASSSSTTGPTRTSSRCSTELGVASQASAMSFSVRNDATGLEYNGTTLNTLFAQRRNLVRPSFLAMVRDILRFNRAGAAAAAPAGVGELPLGELLRARSLQPVLRRRLHHADGRGDLVHQSRIDVRVPGALLRPLPDEPRDADGQRPAAVAHRSPAVRRATWRSSRRRSATASGCARRWNGSAASPAA